MTTYPSPLPRNGKGEPEGDSKKQIAGRARSYTSRVCRSPRREAQPATGEQGGVSEAGAIYRAGRVADRPVAGEHRREVPRQSLGTASARHDAFGDFWRNKVTPPGGPINTCRQYAGTLCIAAEAAPTGKPLIPAFSPRGRRRFFSPRSLRLCEKSSFLLAPLRLGEKSFFVAALRRGESFTPPRGCGR